MRVLWNVSLSKEEMLARARDVVNHNHMGRGQLRGVAETLRVPISDLKTVSDTIERLVDISFGRPASETEKNVEEEGETEEGAAISSTRKENNSTGTTFPESRANDTAAQIAPASADITDMGKTLTDIATERTNTTGTSTVSTHMHGQHDQCLQTSDTTCTNKFKEVISDTTVGMTCEREVQVSIQPTSEDFSQLTAVIGQMKIAFAEFCVESADREVRYQRKIAELTKNVASLEKSLSAISRSVEETEKTLNKKIITLTSKIGELTAHIKTHPATNNTSCVQSASSSPSHSPQRSCAAWPNIVVPRQILTADDVQPQTNSTTSTEPTKNTTSTPADSDLDQQIRSSPNLGSSDEQLPSTTMLIERVTAPVASVQRNRPLPPTATLQESLIQTSPTDQAGGWKLVRPRRSPLEKSSPKPVPLKGANRIRRRVFYLGGIDAQCSSDDIIQYCRDRNVRVASCRLLPSKRFGTTSARLSVAEEDARASEILGKNFWPNLVSIRPWDFPEQSGTQVKISQ